MAFPTTGAQMVLLMSFAAECGAGRLVIGKGTNLLCPDEGLDRLVVETSGLSRLELGTEPDTVFGGGRGVPGPAGGLRL